MDLLSGSSVSVLVLWICCRWLVLAFWCCGFVVGGSVSVLVLWICCLVLAFWCCGFVVAG